METKENTKSHISYSQIGCYLDCSFKHFLRYHEGIIAPPKAVMTLGGSYDFAHSHNLKQKIDSHVDLKESEVLDAFTTNFDVQRQETIWLPGEKSDNFRQEGIELVKKYHSEISPRIQPVAVQEMIKVPFSNLDVEFWAVPDFITNSRLIIDNKVTGKTPTQEDADKSLQASSYCLAYRAKYNKVERGFVFHNMLRRKGGARFLPIPTTRTDKQIDRFLKIIGHVIHGIRNKTYHPCNPENNWRCSEKWCGYWDLCHERF